MKDKAIYDSYPIVSVSLEVRLFLDDSFRELKRQRDQEYQYRISYHAFDVEERVTGDPGGATCDPIYTFTEAKNQSAEKAFFRKEARKALAAAVQDLSESARRRLLLHFLDEFSYSEIARREGITENAVRGQMEVSLKKLRRALNAQGIPRVDFAYRSSFAYEQIFTKNGQKRRDQEQDRKRALAKDSGDKHVA